MNVHIVHIGLFIWGAGEILSTISDVYGLEVISLDNIIRQEILSSSPEADNLKKLLEDGNGALPDLVSNKLIEAELNKQDGYLIYNYPRNRNQFELLENSIQEAGGEIKRIWVFQAINVLKNLKKNKKHRLIAERYDPSLSHIEEHIRKQKARNQVYINIFSSSNRLIIKNVEAYGIEGENSSKKVVEYIKNSVLE
jgi:adenylate kinase family enzyme